MTYNCLVTMATGGGRVLVYLCWEQQWWYGLLLHSSSERGRQDRLQSHTHSSHYTPARMETACHTPILHLTLSWLKNIIWHVTSRNTLEAALQQHHHCDKVFINIRITSDHYAHQCWVHRDRQKMPICSPADIQMFQCDTWHWDTRRDWDSPWCWHTSLLVTLCHMCLPTVH